jgi:hypothetical protein
MQKKRKNQDMKQPEGQPWKRTPSPQTKKPKGAPTKIKKIGIRGTPTKKKGTRGTLHK